MRADANEVEVKAKAAKAASKKLAYLSTEVKNKALLAIADELVAKQGDILSANHKDYGEGDKAGMSAAMLDRLLLNTDRIKGIAADVRTVAALPDPVGETFEMRTLPNGLQVGKKRVPLGVIGAVYESRPNVTVDISVLCLKSGNAVILRGGKEAVNSNSALVKIIQGAAYRAGVPEGAVQFIESTDRALVGRMLKMRDYIDLVIPRGGADLINYVAQNAAMPVVTGGIGVCHTYVDRSANLEKATAIVYNAKVQRPTVCNALDAILVHTDVAKKFLPMVSKELGRADVELRCDEILRALQDQIRHKQNCDDTGTFCPEFPDAHRWLKHKRWQDEIRTDEPQRNEPRQLTDEDRRLAQEAHEEIWAAARARGDA